MKRYEKYQINMGKAMEQAMENDVFPAAKSASHDFSVPFPGDRQKKSTNHRNL